VWGTQLLSLYNKGIANAIVWLPHLLPPREVGSQTLGFPYPVFKNGVRVGLLVLVHADVSIHPVVGKTPLCPTRPRSSNSRSCLVGMQSPILSTYGSRLLARLEDAWGCTIHLDPRHQPPSERRLSHLVGSLRSIVIQLEDYLSSPVFSGFLSSAIRSSPVDDPQTFQQALEMGIHKEIEASIFGYRPTHLDYFCIMSPHSSDRSNPLAPNLDSCPDVAQGIYEALFRTGCRYI